MSAADQQEANASGQPDWEKRFKGLQKKHEQLVLEHRSLQEQLQALLAEKDDLTTKLSALKNDTEKTLSGKTQELEQLRQQLEQEKANASTLQAEIDKIRLIKEKFPDLIIFEDLVPPGEHVEEKLQALQEKIKRISSMQAKQILTGVTPSASPSREEVTKKDQIRKAFEEMNAAAGTPEYDAKARAYYELVSGDSNDQWSIAQRPIDLGG